MENKVKPPLEESPSGYQSHHDMFAVSLRFTGIHSIAELGNESGIEFIESNTTPKM